ncbi:hypothetical protein [Bradyrhizobium sp. AUGA SZCCT0431]|uniref:hypothetical protein n=1 Tax=Bradyrhizobium sp. AUGA SZCCT0431 TaxID=2807674 RepID=UPI001BA648D1|nr:hypothetical protein [Bradyrhizobium sp. AUGA SZCCT0431]MBR1145071.1 hypothetical protein [Bradyrhizobium sp. AUGA SZCCT0431]
MTTTLERPADSAGALYVKTPVTPEEIFRAIGRLRKEARDEIDRLIRFLDSTENHMAIDCEPEDEGDDAELEEDDPGEDDGLHEPALGSLDGHDNQTVWARGGRRDLEVDPAESGIGDYDGLAEQVGSQDWQQGAMA